MKLSDVNILSSTVRKRERKCDMEPVLQHDWILDCPINERQPEMSHWWEAVWNVHWKAIWNAPVKSENYKFPNGEREANGESSRVLKGLHAVPGKHFHDLNHTILESCRLGTRVRKLMHLMLLDACSPSALTPSRFHCRCPRRENKGSKKWRVHGSHRVLIHTESSQWVR